MNRIEEYRLRKPEPLAIYLKFRESGMKEGFEQALVIGLPKRQQLYFEREKYSNLRDSNIRP
jgi:hypothetical protein